MQNFVDFVNSLKSDAKTNYELEVKILLDSRINIPNFIKTPVNRNSNNITDTKTNIMKIINSILDCGDISAEISQTINFIETKTNSMYVKQLCYNNGIQDKNAKNFYSKESMMQPIYMTYNNPSNEPIVYKLSINKETIEIDDTENFDIIRFRLRYSILLNGDLKGWRLDLTFISETQNKSLYVLKKIRDKLFSNQIPLGLLGDFDWEFPDRIELELEYVDDIKKFNISNINQIKKLYDIKPFTPLSASSSASSSLNAEFRLRQVIDLGGGSGSGLVKSIKLTKNIILKTYKECICEIAQILKPNLMHKFKNDNYGLKQLNNNPVELDKKLYMKNVLPKIDTFIATEKIDGIRTMLIIYPIDKICYVINNKNSECVSVKNVTYLDENKESNIKCIILDTESVDIIVNDIIETRFYIFDVIKYQTNNSLVNVSDLPFTERLEYIKNTIKNSNNLLIDGYNFLYTKNFIELNKINYGMQLREFYSDMSKLIYKIDGLILISKNHNYDNTLNYKWKPLNTIDFVAKKCPDNMLGISPYNIKDGKILYLLFCGIRSNEYKQLGVKKLNLYDIMFTNVCVNKYGKTNDSYIPIQFSPSDNPYAYLFWSDNSNLDNTVVELKYDIHINEWELVKIRDDRTLDMKRKSYYGNYFKYAEYIWMNYKNPLSLDILCQQNNNKAYFMTDSTEYIATRKFNNYVKNQIIDTYSKNVDLNWIIDLASGRGQDLFKYIDCKFKNILFTDVDNDALNEIIHMKYLYISNEIKKYDQINTKDRKYSRIHIKKLDLSDNYKKNIDDIHSTYFGIPTAGAQFVVCNLALHYVINNKTKSQNFVNMLNKILSPGGIFILTIFNGKKVFELLNSSADVNGVWNKYDAKNKLIYSIKKKYSDTNFTGTNQKIDVLLPFTNGEYYTENLVNIDILNTQLEKKKIKLINDNSFDTYLDKFDTDKNFFFKQLTNIDKEYISLYHFYIYQKQPSKK